LEVVGGRNMAVAIFSRASDYLWYRRFTQPFACTGVFHASHIVGSYAFGIFLWLVQGFYITLSYTFLELLSAFKQVPLLNLPCPIK
jgi:hypothetical protein